jgi:hypothetical protein
MIKLDRQVHTQITDCPWLKRNLRALRKQRKWEKPLGGTIKVPIYCFVSQCAYP